MPPFPLVNINSEVFVSYIMYYKQTKNCIAINDRRSSNVKVTFISTVLREVREHI